MSDSTRLNEQFGITGQLHFVDGPGGLVIAKIANSLATASIAVQGAHLLTWAPRLQRPVIWLSPAAKFAVGKSVRGGVPICWPWFGPHLTDGKLPGHGYARTVPWEVIASMAMRDGRTQIRLRLQESDATRAQWPHATPVEMVITVGKTLSCELVTTNTSTAAVTIGDALHTYFQVSDVRQIVIHGVGSNPYIDKVDGGKRKHQSGPVTIGSEVDRIYLESSADCLIDDPAWQRRIRIHKYGSASTVIWNPWIEKAEQMGDFGGSEGYLDMVCVESANAADDVVNLAPGKSHRLVVEYTVEKL